jgi:hypothetical protein
VGDVTQDWRCVASKYKLDTRVVALNSCWEAGEEKVEKRTDCCAAVDEMNFLVCFILSLLEYFKFSLHLNNT